VSLKVPEYLLAASPKQQTAYAYSFLRLSLGPSLAPGYDPSANPGFIYDAASGNLGYKYRMPDAVRSALAKSEIPIFKRDAFGNILVEQHGDGQYYFATTTAKFVAPEVIHKLYDDGLAAVKNIISQSPGLQLGGPGKFNIEAQSADMGSSAGVISWGIYSSFNPVDYSSLAPWTESGAAINLTVHKDLRLLTSTIASIFGGDVAVTSGGGVELSLGQFALIPPGPNVCYGIFTSGNSDIRVLAKESIDIGGARIAAFNGGDVYVRSEQGGVNAGNGANSILIVPVVYSDPTTGRLVSGQILEPRPFGSGILALSPSARWQAPGGHTSPGNIRVETPRGDIISTLGGIQQYALDGTVGGGPEITLIAGTGESEGSPGFAGNVDLGLGGVIGGTINITAQGDIKGLIVSRQNANINAAQSFTGTLLSGGMASVNASAGSVSGTIIGIGGVSASGGGGVSAAVMGQNVSIGGGAAQSTLGTSAGATSASQAAAQQASNATEQQLARDTSQEDPEKKRAKTPALTKRAGRVRVILPNS
jgi:hypothetical protein